MAAFFIRALAAIEMQLERERDQLALWLPVGLGIGIGLWFALPRSADWIVTIFVALAVALVGVAIGLQRRSGRSLFVFGLAVSAGMMLIAIRSEWVASPVIDRPLVASFDARIDKVERLPARGIVRLTLKPDHASGLPPKIRVNVADDDPAVSYFFSDAHISLRARIMPPADSVVPGAYNFARLAWFQGIGGTGKALVGVKILAPAHPYWGQGFRENLTTHVQQSISGAPGAIAATLATGDRGAISEADAEAMRRSGLAHLLSISGLHVTAVVGAAMFFVLKLLALSSRLALNWPLLLISAAAGAFAGIGYTLLTGAEVPTIRSCVAALLILAGLALGREAITLRLIATGALFVLLLWPESLVGPSFQMSFAAVSALVALHEHPKIRALLMRREESMFLGGCRALFGLLITGVIVEIALFPIALFHFHKAGVYGAFANIVAIPLTTFVVMPLEALALLFDIIGLGAPFWWLTGKAIAVLLALAHAVAAAPGAVMGLPVTPVSAFTLMVMGGIWIGLWRTNMRWLGVFPACVGALWALATPIPDLLITGDGKHLAILTDGGRYALLRSRAGEYVRATLGESAGSDGPMGALDDARGARCSPDACIMELNRGGRPWRIMALRSRYFISRSALENACASADIVVADRRLPDWCIPRWLKADASFLAKSGGISIDLQRAQITTVKFENSGYPWTSRSIRQ